MICAPPKNGPGRCLSGIFSEACLWTHGVRREGSATTGCSCRVEWVSWVLGTGAPWHDLP